MIWGLGSFDVQRTGEDGVPAGANVSLPVHWDRTALFSAQHTEIVTINELQRRRAPAGLRVMPFSKHS